MSWFHDIMIPSQINQGDRHNNDGYLVLAKYLYLRD